MRFKRILAALFAGIVLVPAAASAQITLSAAGQQQLSALGAQLLTIFTQITQAQAQGTAYTSSPAFQAQGAIWSQQLAQIGQGLSALIASGAQTKQTTIPTIGGNTSTCPNLYRDLDVGAQGSDVAALQLFLANDHYGQFSAGVSGYFDVATALAVERYQAGYNIVSNGSPGTTGFGRVGPGTRASIAAVCARGTYVISVPPITVPTTGPNGIPSPPPPPPAPVQVGYSTGQLSLIPSLTGQSGGPNSVGFSVNMLPNSACSSSAFVLSFGDGQQQSLTASASCGNQVQTITHVYPTTGQFTATLTSGVFSTTLLVSIQQANNSVSLSAASDPNVSLSGSITVTYDPGSTCVPGSYSISFGDNTSQNLSFSGGCSKQTQTVHHVFPQAGVYLIAASDPQGHTVTTSMTASVVASAGAGDPYQVLWVRGEGADNATAFTDSSQKAHGLTGGGGAHTDTSAYASGNSSIRLNGASYVTTPSSSDFNYSTTPFTIDLWFAANSLPPQGSQAALLMQAGSNASDGSLGGAGLEFFGDQIYFVGNIGGVTYHPFYSNTIHTGEITDSEWHHVAAVRTNNTVTLYLDGKAQSALPVTGAANASSAGLSIGRYGDFAGDYFDGWIDNVDIAKGIARWSGGFSTSTLPI